MRSLVLQQLAEMAAGDKWDKLTVTRGFIRDMHDQLDRSERKVLALRAELQSRDVVTSVCDRIVGPT